MAENFLVNANLVSWWMFEESASPAVDGNTTNANNLTWGTAASQSATHKQGSFSIQATAGDGIAAQRAFASVSSNFPGKVNAAAGFTFGGWIYVSSYPTLGDQYIQLFDALATGGWALGTTGVTQGEKFYIDGTGGAIVANSTYTTATWHLVILRYNGDNRSGAGADDEQSLWIDNVKQSTTFAPAAWALATVNPLIWHWNSGGAILYDEWFAFDIALLDTQIADIYASGLAGSGVTPETRTIVMVRGG